VQPPPSYKTASVLFRTTVIVRQALRSSYLIDTILSHHKTIFSWVGHLMGYSTRERSVADCQPEELSEMSLVIRYHRLEGPGTWLLNLVVQ